MEHRLLHLKPVEVLNVLTSIVGKIVPKDDVAAMENAIKDICEHKPYLSDDCIRCATEFGQEEKFEEYVELYRELKKK